MTRKFLTAVLVVAAFGCARSASTPATPHAPTAQMQKTQTSSVAVGKPRELRPVGVAKELTPAAHDENGVALHGPAKTYLEQVDNSGWSGRSPALPADEPKEPPKAIGGGPAADDANEKKEALEQKPEKTEEAKPAEAKPEAKASEEQSEEK